MPIKVSKHAHNPHIIKTIAINILIPAVLLISSVEAHAQKSFEMPPTPVEVAPVELIKVRNSIQFTGVLRPLIATSITAEVDGLITEIYRDEGELVKKGEVIAQLDKSKREIEVRLAKAQLRQSEAELKKLKKGLREEEIRKKQALLKNKTAISEKLKANYERTSKLFSEGIVSKERKQDSKWEFEQAHALQMEAKAELDMAEKGAREEDILIAEQEVEAKRVTLKAFEDNLAKSAVRAKVTGFIISRNKEVGQWVDAGSEIAEIVSMEKVTVTVSVHESKLMQIHPKARVSITFDPYPGKEFAGSIRNIIPNADPKSHAFPVKIEIENKNHELKPGMFAKVNIFTSQERESMAVPPDALIMRGGRFFLFVVVDAKVTEVEVKKGTNQGELVEITGDLKPGDQVVITGNEKLRNGADVNIVKL